MTILNQANYSFSHRHCRGQIPYFPGMVEIVQNLFATPVLTIPYLKKRYAVHYQTAQRDAARLMEAGIIEILPDQRPKSFYSPQIFVVAYGHPEVIEELLAQGKKQAESDGED